MHPYTPSRSMVERRLARRDALVSHDRIDAGRTALVVVDMQNYFVAESYPGSVAQAREIIPTINRLAAAVRQAGGRVAWIQTTSTGSLEHWKNHFADSMNEERFRRRQASLDETSPGFEIHRGLDVAPDDLRFRKVTYSAFVPSPAEIDATFRREGIDMLLIVGAATNVCSETTARHAVTLDYRVIMVSDANATWTDQEHAAALDNFLLFFGDVMTTDEVIARLHPADQPAP
ncbi:cysteine hydrolase family protein [Rhodoplanes roseus]|uniref:Isochorismatase-like domain-containing protein n=1 Tax=Rhodoplanes roseus TaxID=29409 RepID=A0A327KVU4_9BRAD|nr:cysteine hydrolase [Rhodoplanes roseus]RAI43010.1 hypothetical protein CH341_16555 [Rhodoplanes roseus]